MTTRMSREEVEALPPAIDLPTLGRVLGISEPTVRECRRNGDLERAGIRVVKLGAQYRVITESVRAALGLAGSASTEAADGNGAGQGQAPGPVVRSLRGGAAS